MNLPNPIAFSLFGLEVRWYGILIATGMMLGLLLTMKRANKSKKLVQDDIIDIFLWMLPAAILGARLYYVIFEWEYYAHNPSEILAIWHGGMAIHGGILAGILAAFIVCSAKKINFFEMADLIMPGLALGQAIGRWGNFFNQEAHGVETTLPWAITVNDPIMGLVQVHPTFLYESIWNLLVMIGLLLYDKYKKKVEGELLALYFIFYSIGRFFIEGLRTDSLMFFGLRTAQCISLVMILLGMLGFWLLRHQKTNNFKKNKK